MVLDALANFSMLLHNLKQEEDYDGLHAKGVFMFQYCVRQKRTSCQQLLPYTTKLHLHAGDPELLNTVHMDR